MNSLSLLDLSAYIYFLVMGEDYIRILWSNFLKLDNNCTLLFFFGWINLGSSYSHWFIFLSNPKWHRRLTLFLKTASCTLGNRYSFSMLLKTTSSFKRRKTLWGNTCSSLGIGVLSNAILFGWFWFFIGKLAWCVHTFL